MKTASRTRASIRGAIDSLAGTHLKDRAGLVRILDLGQAVRATTALIHELQKERGLSGGFLASEGSLFARALGAQVSRSQEAWRKAVTAWEALPHKILTGALEGAMGAAWGEFGEVKDLRSDVQERKVTHASALQRYTTLVERFLAIVSQAPGTAPHPEVTLALLTLFNFVQAKEWAGQQRALGTAICAQGAFEPFQKDRFLTLERLRSDALTTFRKHATRDQSAAWAAMEASQDFQAWSVLRDQIAAGGEGSGHGPRPEAWFDLATTVIDGLRGVELSLLDDLEALGLHVLLQARSAWEAGEEAAGDREAQVLRKMGDAHLRLVTPGRTSGGALASLGRWDRDLGRIDTFLVALDDLGTRARVLALDAKLPSMDRTEVARGAQGLHSALKDLALDGKELLGILRLSAARTRETLAAASKEEETLS